MIVIVLAAGKGTRMKSDIPKVLHDINDRPMIEYIIDVIDQFDFSKKIFITGDGHEKVEKVIGHRGICVLQSEQLGTGHAVLQAWDYFTGTGEDVIVLYGDTPLLKYEIIRDFIKDYKDSGANISILTTMLDDPGSYGRIVRDGERVSAIVEYKDTSPEEKKIKEINTGPCCYNAEVLEKFLPKLSNNNVQGELYLTDIIGFAVKDGLYVRAFCTEDWQAASGINTREELEIASEVLLKRGKK